jgi:Cu(I)/Ag(I) efflux system membrane fusion protein
MRRRALQFGIAMALVLAGLAAWWLVRARPQAGTAAPSSRTDQQSMADMPGMDGAAPGGTVTLTADQIRAFGITFGDVELRQLEPRVRGTGVVVLDETRVAQVTSKVSGFVERLYVDFTGRSVRRGQPLYALYSPDLVAAQEELLAAARLAAAGGASAVPGLPSGEADLLAAGERRLRLWDVSQPQIEQILHRGAAERMLTFYSPVTGTVLEKQIVRGQAVQPGQSLYTIADLSKVWVEMDLREGDAGAIQAGAQAEVEFVAYPGRPVTGRVAFVAPTLERESRALRARIEVPNGDNRLRPGMYGTAWIHTPAGRTLTVPAAAVVRTGERSLVFVDLLGGGFAAREVEIGRTAGGLTEVLAGLEPGQRVVTSAQFLLESESNLSDIMRSMIGQTGSAEMSGMEGMDDSGGAESAGADVRDMPDIIMPEGAENP